MNTCLCCDSSLLRHIRHSSLYWYCPTCRQDMPESTTKAVSQSFSRQPIYQLIKPQDVHSVFYRSSLTLAN
ncbi:MAG: hypothetical protein KTR27_05070 [Leptolyngbyaceae cyanobacterium MAG.088]|nr:hypothetical protein [Leptolyngbyaceae cyanobacterium MAG.088]